MSKTDEAGEWEKDNECPTAQVWLLINPSTEWKDKRAIDYAKTRSKVV